MCAKIKKPNSKEKTPNLRDITEHFPEEGKPKLSPKGQTNYKVKRGCDYPRQRKCHM